MKYSKYLVALFVCAALFSCATAIANGTLTAEPAIVTDTVSEGIYPVTEGENPSVAKDRALFLAQTNAQKTFFESIKNSPLAIEKKLTDQQCFALAEALTVSATAANKKTADSNNYYVRAVSTIDLTNLQAYLDVVRNPQISRLLDSVNTGVERNFGAISELRTQYTNSKNQSDRQNIENKIKNNENDFMALTLTLQSYGAYVCGDYEAGKAAAGKALDFDKNYTNAFFIRGLNRVGAKDPSDAIMDYTSAIKCDPKFFDAYNNRALLYAAANDTEKAIADYTSCISLKPDSDNSYVQRGTLYYKSGKNDLAFADFNRALAFDPQNITALTYRAELLYKQKLYDLAIADYSALLKIDPGNAQAYLHRATAYYDKGDFNAAVADYNKATELGVNDPLVLLNIGNICFEQKKYDDAIAAYNKYLVTNNNDTKVFIKLGNCYDERQQYENAIVEYTNALAFDKSLTTYFLRANDYYLAGASNKTLFDSAVADCSAIIALDANNVDAYVLRGRAYKAMKNLEQAIADFSKAIELAPASAKSAVAYSCRAWCYYEKGGNSNNIHATQDFQKARIVDPSNPDYDYNLAQFYDTIRRAKSDTVNAYKAFIRKAAHNPVYCDKIEVAKKRIIELGGQL